MLSEKLFVLILLLYFILILNYNFINAHEYLDNICDRINGQKIYLEFGEKGTLVGKNNNYTSIINNNNGVQNRCHVQLVTCPSCIIHIKFRFLNISRNCRKPTVFDSCGCDYVWIYEPSFEEISSEQFCGHFINTNNNSVEYVSRTKNIFITFFNSVNYGHAFTLEYYTKRNRIAILGQPNREYNNNSSQLLTSPFFPKFYLSDLSMEHIIECQSTERCRIILTFTDYQIADSSIIEFFDYNGQRIHVTTGNIFRPPIIVTTGPGLLMRFYANGASNIGFKATYSFLLGNLNDSYVKPNIDCGGYVNNLGGGITMMNMAETKNKSYDCIWIIKPSPNNYYHMKTHLYVKVVTFVNFLGSTELKIHQGLTSSEPLVEILKVPISRFYFFKDKDHVVPINQGFYISFKGIFKHDSRIAIVYTAFNYKDCFAGSDFLCHNLRCIAIYLNCDGLDHCGDNSDELSSCSQNIKEHKHWSNTPNFLFPKINNDLTTATLVFLLSSLGLIGVILAMIILLNKIYLRKRQTSQVQNHLETIHAILEESTIGIEEIIVPDEPPHYEAPPDYGEIINKLGIKKSKIILKNSFQSKSKNESKNKNIPDSPPPSYSDCSKPGPSRMANINGNNKTITNTNSIIRDRNGSWQIKKKIKNTAQRLINFKGNLVKFYSDSELNDTSLYNENFTIGNRWRNLAFSSLRSYSNDNLSSIFNNNQ